MVFILKTQEISFSKLQNSSLSLIHEKNRTCSAFFIGIYKEILQLFMEKNKLQPKTRSRQAHKILFLGCWRHKSKVMAIGLSCTYGLSKFVGSRSCFRSHHCETCTKQSLVCLRSLLLTSPLTRVLYHLPYRLGLGE